MKILTVIGARPQIIKAAALSRTIASGYSHQIIEHIVHTGQHYDDDMSAVFFKELGIPEPTYRLNVGSMSHGAQTARMTEGIEQLLLKNKYDAVVLYGDTNSTLAGAIAASKLHVPVVHIEAGLRSFNKSMPEEINRIVCDHVSTLLFSPTATGYKNLMREGFSGENAAPFTADHPGVFHCGDVMYDNSMYYSKMADMLLLQKHSITPGNFALATIHRNNNTDDLQRLAEITRALAEIAKHIMVVWPVHPRTSQVLMKHSAISELLGSNENIKLIPPASFLGMIALEQHCSVVITDSGGVQKEAFFFRKPCIILREETEWVELTEAGAAKIAGTQYENIMKTWVWARNAKLINMPDIFGSGNAAGFICETMLNGIYC
jgi:UDP-GlcNAc3NAcA epimerase